MAELFLFRLEIGAGATGDAGLAGNALDDADAVFLELANLFGIIGEQSNGTDAELSQDSRGECVIPCVSGKSEFLVGLYSVATHILQLVGLQFVHKADAPAFLREIEQHAGARAADFAKRQFELCAAIAALGAEDIAGEALGMDANKRSGVL